MIARTQRVIMQSWRQSHQCEGDLEYVLVMHRERANSIAMAMRALCGANQ